MMTEKFSSILLIGAEGMLGRAFAEEISQKQKNVKLTAVDIDQLDVTRAADVASFCRGCSPDLVINASAYTNVDGAEVDPESAFTVNAEAIGNICEGAAENDAMVVHFSTDFVFDGTADEPYPEDHPVNPLSTYGESKRQGEINLIDSGVDFLLIRTSWLYGPGGKNFPLAIAARAKSTDQPLKVVSDQRGRPTYTLDLVEATFCLLQAGASGIYHVQNSGPVVSWADVARFTLQNLNLSNPVEELTSAEWFAQKPDSARRPKMSALSLNRYFDTIGKTPRPWEDAMTGYLRDHIQ